MNTGYKYHALSSKHSVRFRYPTNRQFFCGLRKADETLALLNKRARAPIPDY